VLAVAVAAPAGAGTLGVYQSDVQGFDTRTYWYDDGREVTVFDTQFTPALAEAMVSAIRAATPNPITRVVVTHPNPDKFNGLSVFHALGATSIASAATAAAMPGVDSYKRAFWIGTGTFTAATYPRLEPIRQAFRGQHRITLASGETITLTELRNPGVSTTQTVARIDATGDLIVGDLVHGNAHAWLEGGIAEGAPRPDIAGWIRALAELPALGGRVVRGGRGDDLPVAEAVAQQTDYLRQMDDLVTAYVAGLGARRPELRDPARAPAHHAAIQQQAEALFPGRRLSYLVGYGVYGLANSKL
jgi:glyoxylase-like metal-dependent hydrolase (beta-lactamase superfamily II)